MFENSRAISTLASSSAPAAARPTPEDPGAFEFFKIFCCVDFHNKIILKLSLTKLDIQDLLKATFESFGSATIMFLL